MAGLIRVNRRQHIIGIAVLVIAWLAGVGATADEPAEARPRKCGLPPAKILSKRDVPRGIDVSACDLRGRWFDLGVTTLPMPAIGQTVGMSRLETDGETTATLTVDEMGEVTYSASSPDTENRATPRQSRVDARAALRTDGCDYADYNIHNFKVSADGWSYYIGDGTQPAGGSQADTPAAAQDSASAWYNQKSPCTRGDYTYVPRLSYIGTDSRESDFDVIDGESDCGEPDKASTIDSGDLRPNGTVALTCWWTMSQPGTDTVRTADIRLNTTDQVFTFTPLASSCGGRKWDVQSILTHEMGHVLGIDDEYDADAKYQTMYGAGEVYKCQNYKRSLASGDVAALLVRY